MEAFAIFDYSFMFTFAIVALAIYILFGIILFKLNKAINKKVTLIAWIPIVNIYLLGKLTVNKIVGWILIIILFLITNHRVPLIGQKFMQNISLETSYILFQIYLIILFALFIYAIGKLINLEKEIKKETMIETAGLELTEQLEQKNVFENPSDISIDFSTSESPQTQKDSQAAIIEIQDIPDIIKIE